MFYFNKKIIVSLHKIHYLEMDEDLQVVRGEVLAHSKEQEDIYQAIEKVGQQPLAIEYVGEVPEGIAFIL